MKQDVLPLQGFDWRLENVAATTRRPRQTNSARTAVHVLSFVQRARSRGFSVNGRRELLDLFRNAHRTSAEVKALTTRLIAEIDGKMAETGAVRGMLVRPATALFGAGPVLTTGRHARSSRTWRSGASSTRLRRRRHPDTSGVS